MRGTPNLKHSMPVLRHSPTLAATSVSNIPWARNDLLKTLPINSGVKNTIPHMPMIRAGQQHAEQRVTSPTRGTE